MSDGDKQAAPVAETAEKEAEQKGIAEAREKATAEYRASLLTCDKSSVEEYDKAVMTLSGGAIGLSFTFFNDIGREGAGFLFFAWVCWGFSVTAVLCSHFFSHLAMRRALSDLDEGKLNYAKPGRLWDTAINVLNPTGGILFLIGVLLLTVFVWCNVTPNAKNPVESSKKMTTTTTTTTTTRSPD